MVDLKIACIVTYKQFFVAKMKDPGEFSTLDPKRYWINGLPLQSTYHSNWAEILEKPNRIQKLTDKKQTNYRYKLKDPSFKSDKVPEEVPRDEVAEYDSGYYEWAWKDEYEHLESLYELVWDEIEPTWEDVEFECEYITLDLPELQPPPDFKDTVVKHQLIDCIRFPELSIHTRPASISAQQFYSIIRHHVKGHIDYDYAEITSDYNFCFTVKKRILLAKEEKLRKGRIVKYRDFIIFETAPKPYQKYPVLKGLVGKDEYDLKRQIDDYLKQLMEAINEPIKDCPQCQGRGVVDVRKFQYKGKDKNTS